MNSQVGADIRALRKSRKMTLKETAAAVDRSPAWLSLVERGCTTTSVDDLARIARLFNLNISFFFRSAQRSEDEQGVVLRADDRMQIGSRESGLVEELLSPKLSGGFEMIQSTFAPHSASRSPRTPSEREDGGIVVEGSLHLTVGEKEFHLKKGDSFQFSKQPYSWRNNEGQPAVVVWVISPPVY